MGKRSGFDVRSLELSPHIAFVLPSLGAGGTEHVVSLLSNYLAGLGWIVTLFVFEDEITPFYEHDPRITIVPLGRPRRPRSRFGPVGAVRQRVRLLRHALVATQPDLILSFIIRTNVIAVLAATRLHIPVIVSEQNNPKRQSPGLIWAALRRYAYTRSAGLITMTRGAMNCFPPSMRRTGWVIPNPSYCPIPLDPRRPMDKRIVAVGRLVWQKGFDLLLHAFARIASAHPEWTLTIWGEGPERQSLEKLLRPLGITGRAFMPGCTERPGSWLAEADILVLSSRFEGWGMVVGEAMAAGLPAVAFDCPFGPSQMIRHGYSGLLVPEGNVEALADALDRLCADGNLRQKLGDAARLDARRFAPELILSQWEEAIVSVLAHTGSHYAKMKSPAEKLVASSVFSGSATTIVK